MEQSASTTGSLDMMKVLDGLKPFLRWWNLKSWNFYENCGVHTLTLEDGTEIHMLAERKYPLTKETLKWMMSLKLIAESASESDYNLLRADSLLKPYGFSTHHALTVKELASPKAHGPWKKDIQIFDK
ncbi:hypothetical protein Tco_0251572 [Tanacetum coccineum]